MAGTGPSQEQRKRERKKSSGQREKGIGEWWGENSNCIYFLSEAHKVDVKQKRPSKLTLLQGRERERERI